MKKLLLILLFLFTLCSCSSEEKIDTVIYLNSNDAAVYLYNEMVEEDYEMDNFIRINTIQPEIFTHNYSCIIINVEANRSSLNEDVVDSFYDLLSNKKIMIIFYEGKDYSYFRNTRFYYYTEYNHNVYQIYSFNNFNNEIDEVFSDSNTYSYLACLSHLEYEIKEYRGNL